MEISNETILLGTPDIYLNEPNSCNNIIVKGKYKDIPLTIHLDKEEIKFLMKFKKYLCN